ncbi:hypothetical protein MBLNU13_g03636t1 [Cladosporium sp. NU13]
MAQVRPEVNLGRSILTPRPSRQKFTAKRTGNLLPMGHDVPSNITATSINKQQHVASTALRPSTCSGVNAGDTATTPSTSNDRLPCRALTAKMESSQARNDREARIAYSGKGKGRAISPVSKEAPSPVVGNDDTPEQTEPLLTSDVLIDSQQKALEDAKRYQEQVDRYERQRDREDTDFLDLGTQEDDSQTQEDVFESPRRRSRRIASDSVMPLLQDSVPQQSAQAAQPDASKKTPVKQKQLPIQQKPVEERPSQRTPVQAVQQPPVQQISTQQKQPAPEQPQQQQPKSRKRKADTEIASEHPRLSPIARSATLPNSPNLPTRELRVEQKSRTTHNNKRFELCKIESQTRRKDAIKTIKKSWGITEDQLMRLPNAPRIASKQDQPIIKPLNWNTKLLEAVALLADVTKGNFPHACIIANNVFEEVGRPGGAKQLTAEILLGKLFPRNPGSGSAQVTTGITSVQQPASGRRQSAPGSAPPETPASEGRESPYNIAVSRGIPSRPSLLVKLPVNAQSPPVQATSSVTAYPSPPAPLIKSEHVVPIMQQEGPDGDDGLCSGSEERLNLETRKQILKHELAIIQLKLEIDDRKKRKERERKAARRRQPGGSVENALLV